jgi:hypothetical protein
MKPIRNAILAGLLLISALSAQAAEYVHFSGPTWRSDVEEFLKKWGPDPSTVTAGITGQGVVHIYCVPGGTNAFKGTYTLLLYPKHPTDRANNTIKALVDGGVAKIFGFVGDDVYVLTWTKPPQ